MKCPNCGTENDSRRSNCQDCGNELPLTKQRPVQITTHSHDGKQTETHPPRGQERDYLPERQEQTYAPQQIYNDAYAVCPRCGGKMLPQTVAEMKRRGFFTIIFWLILCVISLGIIPLIFLIRGRKSKTITYMVCQRCGYRLNSNKLKNWK